MKTLRKVMWSVIAVLLIELVIFIWLIYLLKEALK